MRTVSVCCNIHVLLRCMFLGGFARWAFVFFQQCYKSVRDSEG